MTEAKNLLEVRDLKTIFHTEDGVAKAVDGVSFDIKEGEVLGLVGESGSGKSVTALSCLRLIPNPPGDIAEGRILMDGTDILQLPYDELRSVRGNKISMIFQEPMTSLNPVFTIGYQVMETILNHENVTHKEAEERAVQMLDLVGIPSPRERLYDYPHQYSGGMRQRVMIAIALACNPQLLIADEPTTALDVTIQAQILDLMLSVKEKHDKAAILLITHDLAVVAEMCQRVIVMYCGKIQEVAAIDELFAHPAHPYTVGLMNSIPRPETKCHRLKAIRGMVPNILNLPSGCRFRERCDHAFDLCADVEPELIEVAPNHWSRCHLNDPNVKREEIGLWPRQDKLDGVIPNIKGIFWQGSDWFNQLTNINKEIQAIEKMELVVCMDSTITPSGLFADVLFPIASHFERHDVALPWYKGHYYIHRPKVIQPLGESKTDFQVFTELAYRIGHLTGIGDHFGKSYNPKAGRNYFHYDDDVDEAYLREWWETKVMAHQHVTMSWDDFKKHGVYKFKLDQPHVAFREQIEQGKPFATPSGKIEILSSELAVVDDWTRTRYGSHIPSIPKWIEPTEYLDSPIAKKYPFHLISPHPRWRTHSIFNNCAWLRETYEQEVTLNASDAAKLGIKTGDTVEIWNDRGGVVVPAYVTERVHPGVLVLHEGAWMDRDAEGWDRAGNPDFLTDDAPSPAGAFAYNNAQVRIRKTDKAHRPGWDQLATSRSHVFRRDN